MTRTIRHGALAGAALAGAALALCGSAALAQLPAPIEPAVAPVTSMGQPPQWLPYVAGTGTFGRRDADLGSTLLLGVYRPLTNPVTGLFGVGGEVYGTAGGAPATGGVRLLGVSRAVNLGVGVDWDARTGNSVLVVSWNTATQRGGLFGHGATLRVDWLPARSHTLGVGVTVPLAQPYAGRTRPTRTGVSLPLPTPTPAADDGALPPAADSALAAVDQAAGLIRLYSNFFRDGDESSVASSMRAFRRVTERVRDSLTATSPRYPHGRSFAAVQRVYGAELARAFGLAAGSAGAGIVVGERARAGLLDHVILPYDALFGRVKDDERDVRGLTSAARAAFARWLRDSSAVPAARWPAVLAVHARWLAIVADVQHELVDQWDDSRRIWLPLQLALAPEQYDEQAEVDALVARAVARPFTDGNGLTYLRSTDLPREFARSVLAARDYHVLWIHDFVGRRPSGAMDRLSYREVADAYYPALTQAVKRYGNGDRFPVYLIFLDQYFYEETDGRLWMTILADPLGAEIDLPGSSEEAEAHLRARQRELRAAVAASAPLQAEAARHGGAAWLREVVKVHVSITQPSDFTFRSHRIIPPIPFLPDNLMRDHRKIAFYDITEAEPYRGAMLLTGAGIGAHYASPTWDDRGLVVRGPAALVARAEARELLRRNGFSEDEIPLPLRERAPGVATTDAESAARDSVPPPGGQPSAGEGPTYPARALQVHNEPGFGRKESSVARAMLYSLAPAGSVIIVPDPLWLGSTWAGMLAGAALRGCTVLVIAPAAANGPGSQAPVLARSYDVLLRLLRIQEAFGDQIRRAGGELRVGIYATTVDVNDVAAQARAVRAGLDRSPWIRELIPFDSATVAVLDSVAARLRTNGYEPVAPGRDLAPRPPQLHHKMQFVADSTALATLARRPQWPEVLRRSLLARARQTTTPMELRDLAAGELPPLPDIQPRARLLREYEAARTADERRRVSFYFVLGTQNHDPRGMMLDGETTLVVSGAQAAIGLVDLYFLLAQSSWITRQAELDRYIPPQDGWMQRLARYIRFVL